MLSRFNRYPGGKILGFGAPPKMQKRNFFFETDEQVYMLLGICALGISIPPLAMYLAYKSYKYFRNNYEIVRKNKVDDKSIHSSEKNISENHQSIRRPKI